MRICNTDHRFSVQRVDRDTWLRATAANALADYLAGYRRVVEEFLASRSEPYFERLSQRLRDWTHKRLDEHLAASKQESLVMLVMMLTGACNANCSICFTDRRRKNDELTPGERDNVLRQARALGARFVYVPGEGEPTIDPGFWSFLRTCRELGLEAVIFTNGIVLSDSGACRQYFGFEPKEAVRQMKDFPVSLYFKFWSTRPAVVGKMMNVSPSLFHWTQYDGILLPEGLVRLLEGFPRERVGIEVVVDHRNADEVVNELVPFAEGHGLARIVEMLQHNGRIIGDGAFDPTSDQARRVRALLSPTSCSMATCKAVVTSRGFLSPRIAILEHQIPGTPVNVRSADLFHLLHNTRALVERRYDIVNCLCEQIPMELAKAKPESLGFVPMNNIAPPSLAVPKTKTVATDHWLGERGVTRDG